MCRADERKKTVSIRRPFYTITHPKNLKNLHVHGWLSYCTLPKTLYIPCKHAYRRSDVDICNKNGGQSPGYDLRVEARPLALHAHIDLINMFTGHS